MAAAVPDLSDAEYERIEDALLSSTRGRAFLRMRDRRNRVVAVDDVRRLLRDRKPAAKKKPGADQQTHIHILRRELQELSAHIAETRREIAALRPDDPSANRIMIATEELDAILQATEHATTEILTRAERIQTVADRLRDTATDSASILDDEVIGIMTACSFQDITGQRMTKVVNTLRYIERRVHAMIQIWGVEGGGDDEPHFAGDPRDTRPDAHLMHGPALRDGIGQDAVDALLAGTMEFANDRPPPPVEAQAPTPAAKPPERDPVAAGPALSQSAVDDLFP